MTDIQLNVYLVTNIFIAVYIVIISFPRRNSKGGQSILFLSLAVLFCYIFYLQSNLSASEQIKRISIALTYLGMTLAITAVLTFSLEITFQIQRITLSKFLLFSIVPVLTQILFWMKNLKSEKKR